MSAAGPEEVPLQKDELFEQQHSTICSLAKTGDSVALSMFLVGVPGVILAKLLAKREAAHDRTPLFIACVAGHVDVARLLLDAGSVQGSLDHDGWTEKEQAAFRGHMRIAELLTLYATEQSSFVKGVNKIPCGTQISNGLNLPSDEHLPCQRNRLATQCISPNAFELDPVLSHTFLSLGPANSRSKHRAIELMSNRYNFRHVTRPYSSSKVILTTQGATVSSLNNSAASNFAKTSINRPVCVSFHDADAVILSFQVRASSEEGSMLQGTAVARLSTLMQGLGPQTEALLRDVTIPITDNNTMAYMGTLTFNHLLVTPYQTPQPPLFRSPGFWNKTKSTSVVGHRGSGANSLARTHLQIAENTIQSFLAASNLGATCIEFDVQLTKDLRSVIFHDFLVNELGADVPLHTLSFEQFMHLSRSQAPSSSIVDRAEAKYFTQTNDVGQKTRRIRSQSINAFDEQRVNDAADRIRLTDEGKEAGVKGNIRGYSIQQPAATLEQLLTELPEYLPFNLEIKYPMLWEAQDRHMEPFAQKINLFVDTILDIIFRLCGRRNITLSSFSPEICILLACKQQSFPILFINKGGMVPAGDVRAGSLQGAIEFAKVWGLAGIVMVSDPFVMCPRLLQYAVDSGLVVGSYGPLNDDPECAKIQADAGLHAIMTNKIRLISETLRASKEGVDTSTT